MLDIYKSLVKSFSDTSGFDGWVIIKTEFNLQGKPPDKLITGKLSSLEMVDVEEIKRRRNYCVLQSRTVQDGMEYTLVVYLARPGKESFRKKDLSGQNSRKYNSGKKNFVKENLGKTGPARKNHYLKNGSYLVSLSYTKEDIRQFVHQAGDSNYIHQEYNIVPGFLVFGDVLGKLCPVEIYQRTADIKKEYYKESYMVTFRKPAFAGDVINVLKTDNNRLELILARRGDIYGEIIYNRGRQELYRH